MRTRRYEMSRLRACQAVFLLSALPMTAGCGIVRAIAMYTAPTTEKVPAEFNRLPGHTVLVHVYALPEIRWAYDKVDLDLAASLSGYLQQNVKDVTVVDCLRVASYLEKHPASEADPPAVGKEFNADMVIHLSVYKLTMRDPGYAQFYRGRLGASVEVFDLTKPSETPERIPLSDVEVVVPEKGPVGLADVTATQMRQQTYIAFTDKVGKKFHEYERPID
jgi:hypothetical protein